MNKNRIIFLFMTILLCLFALNAAFASDINDEVILNEEISANYQLNEDISDIELMSGNEDVLSDENSNSFSDLNQSINGNQNESVYLNADYTFNEESDSDFIQGIPIERNVTIYGNGHTLNANNQSRIFTILNNRISVVFRDIIFINGNGADGGAIYGKSTAVNCTFINNTADYGGAIYAQSNNFEIVNCTFEGNLANEDGGSIYFDTVGHSTISNSVFKNNKAKNGASVGLAYSQSVSILNSNFTDNEAELNGGAIDSYFSVGVMIDYCNFVNNMATEQNGGAISWILSKGNISNSEFNRNSAKENGGAIYFEIDNSSSMVQGQHLSNSNFTANMAKNGGAIYNNDFYMITEGNLRFTSNSADENGGAVYCRDNCNFLSSSFKLNSAGENGGAIYCGDSCNSVNSNFLSNTASGNGGAIYSHNKGYFYDSNFTDNHAVNGGAVYSGNATTFADSIFINNGATGNGGAVCSNENSFFLDSNFTENSAVNGGAAYCGDSSSIYGSYFADNEADENGGAVHCSDKCRFTDSTLKNNHAVNGGAVFCQENNTFSSCEFLINSAISGSAIYMDDDLNSVYNSSFIQNKAEVQVLINNEYLKLTIFMNGKDNHLNAIYSYSTFEYSNVSYWAGEIVNTDDVPPTPYTSPGVDFIIEIYDSNNNLINITPFKTPDNGEFIFDYTFLDAGNYTCKIIHEEDEYYYGYIENKTLNVGDFLKLQCLLHNATENSTINLTQDYTYSIDFDGVMSLHVEKANTIINGNGHVIDGSNQSIDFEANSKGSIWIYNCTFINGINFRGGNMDNISFINCSFINCSSPLYLYTLEKGQLINCSFVNSSAVKTYYVENFEIINSSFENSSNDDFGGACNFENSGSITIKDSNFTGNHASHGGGSIYVIQGNLTLDGCAFIDNSAQEGGAIGGNGYDVDLRNCGFYNNSADLNGGAIISNGHIVIDNCEFINNSASAGSAIHSSDEIILKNSIFLNNTASSDSLESDMANKFELEIIFLGKDNLINAIYSSGTRSFENVTYWNGEILNSDDVAPVENNYKGVSIGLEIYDDEDNLVKNVTLTTDDENRIHYDLSELDNGNFKFTAYHLDDDYYSFIGDCNGSFVISRNSSSVTINIEDNVEFDYLDCTISFEIINRTAATILITSQDGSIVYINQSTDKDFIEVNLSPSEDYYNITVFNKPTIEFEGSEDSKLFKIVKGSSSVNITSISDVVYGEAVAVDFEVWNLTVLNVNVKDSNNSTVFSKNTTSNHVEIEGLPAGTYNITFVNEENDFYKGSRCSAIFTINKTGSSITVEPISDLVYGNNATVVFAVENMTTVNVAVKDRNNVTVYSVNTTSSPVVIPGLPVGTYNVTLTNLEGESYNESSCSTSFTVLKAASSISVDSIGDIVYGDTATVGFTVDNMTTVNVIVKDGNDNTVYEINTTESPVVLSELPVGTYNVTLINVEDETYTQSNCSTTFSVLKAASSISVDPIGDIVYGDTATVGFTVDNVTTVNVIVKDRNNDTVYELNNTENPFVLPELPVGTYKITLINVEDESYTQSECSADFNVVKAGSSITVETIPDIVYGDTAAVNFNVENKTQVNVIVKDSNNNTVYELNNTESPISLLVLAVGTYKITLINIENENYTQSSDSTEFKVIKAGSSISVDPISDIIYGDTAEVSFNVENKTQVNVIIADSNNNTVYELNNTESLISLPALPVGTYKITLINIENENYTQSSDSTNFNVVKAGSSITVETISDIIFGDSATVSFTVENKTQVNVIVKDSNNNTVFSQNTTDDSIVVPDIAVGTYTVTLTNIESESYSESNCTATFKVVKAGSSISVNPIADVVFGDNVTIGFTVENKTIVNVIVKDSNNNIVFSKNTTDDSVVVPDLAVGTYTVTLTNIESESYNESNSTATFNVIKAGSSITVDPIANIVYGDTASISFTVENMTSVTVTVKNSSDEIVYATSVTSSPIVLPELAVGAYTITLINVEYESYTQSNCTATFNVVKAGSSISVNPIADVVYGDNAAVTFAVENKTMVNVIVKDSNNNTVFSQNTTDDSVVIPDLAVGTYKITLINVEGESYTQSECSTTFNVVKAGSSITVEPISDIVYGDSATVSFNVENKTQVNVIVTDSNNNTVFSQNTTDDSVVIPDLAVGTYKITLTNIENENYTQSSDSTDFKVIKAGSSISVDPIADIVYGDSATVSFTVENKTQVNVIVTDSNNNTVYEINNTESPISLPVLPVGTYKITLINIENENYTQSSDSTDFKVIKAGSSINVNPIGEVVYGNNVTVSFAVENMTQIKVNVTDSNGNTVFIANVSGESVVLPVLPAGAYNVTLTNEETDNIIGSNSSTLFNIVKADNNVQVHVDDVVYGNDAIIIIQADADGEYNVNINGTVHLVNVVGGKGNISLDLDIGEYYANATFDNSNYNSNIINATFNVLPVGDYNMTVSSNAAIYGEDAIITVSLPRKATGNVTVKIGDENYTGEVVNGTASIRIPNLNAGNFTATVIYSGDDIYSEKTSDIVIRVKKVIVDMHDARYGWAQTIKYQAKLTDEDGNNLSNKEVVFSIDGKTFKAVTNADGIAVVNLNLKIGNYVMKLNSAYGNASSKITIVSRFSGNKNIKMYYFDGTKYTFKVYGDNGQLAGANQVVTVKFNKKTYKLKTNKNGVISLTVPKTVKPGKYTITASYKGQTIKKTITVKKILSSKKTVKVKKTAKKLVLKAKLKKKLKGKRIIFKFRGKKYKAKTNKKGIAKVVIKKKVLKKLKKGKKYPVRIYYYKTSLKTKVKVKK